MAADSQLVDLDKLQEDIKTSKEDNESLFSVLHGRRYASLGNYYMPNDAPEVHRLNDQHVLLTLAKECKLHHAPIQPIIERPLRVLDVGCGTGIWAIQLAQNYPDTITVVGMDVSPIQPANRPSNVEWVTADMEADDWPFPAEYFDFIHLSLVHGCVVSWPDFYRSKIDKYLKPRGWIEHQEFSLCRQYTVSNSSLDSEPEPLPEEREDMRPFLRWGRLMQEAGEKRGRPLQLGPELASFQASTGLNKTGESVYRIPTGTWPSDPLQRDIGTRMMLSALQGMEGFTTVLFTKVLGWSLEDTNAFILEVKRDLRDDSMRKVMDLHVVWSQKPMSMEHEAKKGLVYESGKYQDSPEKAWRSLLGSQSVQFAGGMLLGGALVAIGASWLIRPRR